MPEPISSRSSPVGEITPPDLDGTAAPKPELPHASVEPKGPVQLLVSKVAGLPGGTSNTEWGTGATGASGGTGPSPLKSLLNATCAVTSDLGALELARKYAMTRGGLAEQQLTHFLSGKGTTLELPLGRVLAGDRGMRASVMKQVEMEIAAQLAQGKRGTEISGVVFVAQKEYSEVDNRRALGGTYIWFTVDGSADGRAANQRTGTLRINLQLADRYFFSPNDETRDTQCLHRAGEHLVKAGKAKEFDQVGTTMITLPLRDEDVFNASSDDSLTQVPEAMRGIQSVAPLQIAR